ncbi:MAG: tetratricopeptide repeat protein [Desulfuromonadales bacterium]|nr:tetratricopeptide repeat protein [Desulfuromonadales bacterium]
MKRVITLLLLLVIAGCASGRDQQPRFGKNNPAAYHYQMGLSYLGERNFTGALIELTEAEKLDPDNPELLYNLGLAYIGKRRPDLAEQRLQKAIMLKPNYSVARNDLGVAYLELKRWDSAIQQFKIVKDDIFYENSESATINLGLAYLGKGDYPKALVELRSVAAGNPRNPVVHLSIGRVLFAMDKTEQAVAEYRKALDIYSDYGSAHYNIGLAYLKLNDKAAARASFKETVRVMPETDQGRSALEYLDLLK